MTFDLSTHPRVLRALRISRAAAVPVLAAGVLTAGFPGLSEYRVKPGDTLSAIADRHNTTIKALVSLNDLPGNGNTIYAGETLKVPGRRTGGSATKTKAARVVTYTVRSGDTVGGIALRYKIRRASLLSANHLSASSMIFTGQRLRVPVAGAPKKSNNTFAGRTYADSVVAAADRNRAILQRSRALSKSAIRKLIVKTARRHGVNPNLALAIAWQESGWKQRVVSPANAIGTMQVIPATGRFSSSLVGRDLDLLKTRDNITAGVVLLDRLTDWASTPNAIAGYYQGLGSVRRNGMFTDTKEYVASVQRLKTRLDAGWDPLR